VPFLVLEWLEGRDLASELAARRSPLSEAEAVALLRPAVEALAFAHELGIAHRDVKPQNLFVTRTARGLTLKVLDFGIAKAMQEGETATALATKTSSGFQAFSPVYGAPEQFASKKHGQTGPWTDVHALGLVLTEMVSGQSPYKGKSWPTGPWRPCRPSGLRHARAVPA
jgi:serine/threonine-protein kinase